MRRVDDVFLIDSSGNILISDSINYEEKFVIPSEENFNEALDGKIVFVSNNLENKLQ